MRSTPHSERRWKMKSATSSATGGSFRKKFALRSISLLEVDETHVAVPVARRRALRKRLLDALSVLLGQLDVARGDVLLEITHTLRSGYRDNVVALREHPRERELRGRDA